MFAVAFLYICFTATMFLHSLIMTTNHYPLFVAGARMFGSGVILLSLYLSKHKKSTFNQLQQLISLSFFKYTFCLYVLSAIGFSWGMQYTDPVTACFLFVLSPFITALILFVWYNEKLTKFKLYGLIIGFFAVVPIILESTHGDQSQLPWHVAILGYLVFICAIIAFSYGWIVQKELLTTIHASSSLITAVALTLGGSITLLMFFISHGSDILALQLTETFWWLLLLFAMLTAISYNLYASLLKRYSPTFISFASFLEPAFGMLYASVFLGHTISRTSLLALLALSLGLYLFYKEELNTMQVLL